MQSARQWGTKIFTAGAMVGALMYTLVEAQKPLPPPVEVSDVSVTCERPPGKTHKVIRFRVVPTGANAELVVNQHIGKTAE